MEELRWVRSTTPSLLPKYLVEQVKHRDYEVDDFLKYQENMCYVNTREGRVLNPFSHLYFLANEENMIKGFLWVCVDPLTKDLIIQTYSVDKEYTKSGGAVDKLCIHIKAIAKGGGLNKIYWITNSPRHSQRHGFKKSKAVLMEYSGEEKITEEPCDNEKDEVLNEKL